MYIIIVGGGMVGEKLAQDLLEGAHEVLLIERSAERSGQLKDKLGSVVMTGDGCEVATLAEAGAERAGVFITVTEGDEDNLVACLVAKHRFHVPHIIARVNKPKNERVFRQLGIQATVNAVESVSRRIMEEVPGQAVTHLKPFEHNGLSLVGVRIPLGARAVGKRLADLSLPPGSRISAVVAGNHEPKLANPDLVLQPEDEVVAMVSPEDEPALVEALTE